MFMSFGPMMSGPKVHFNEESKFNVNGSDGKSYVRRKVIEQKLANWVRKVKHGGGSVSLGFFSTDGPDPLIREAYMAE